MIHEIVTHLVQLDIRNITTFAEKKGGILHLHGPNSAILILSWSADLSSHFRQHHKMPILFTMKFYQTINTDIVQAPSFTRRLASNVILTASEECFGGKYSNISSYGHQRC